ncbi:MAG: HWE histidine kinase domain-containing protein [Roseicyclus sp.]
MGREDEIRRIEQLEADNKRLRRLLEVRDAPAELRHRLRSTTALLRSIIRRSSETKRDLEDYVAHLEDRLDAVMRAQETADVEGNVDLRRVLEQELFHYGEASDARVHVSGPRIFFRPRAGQTFALAIHELAVNSVEHGVLGEAGGRLDVVWSIVEDESGQRLVFAWNEHDGARPAEPGPAGFGTEFLTQALAYELKAETRLDFEPDGLRCTIAFPLTQRIAEVGPVRVS